MNKAIDSVKEHFSNYKTRKIVVPEWNNLEIFVEPITLEQKKRILDKSKSDEVEALVYALIWLAKDSEGKPHFTVEDKFALMKKADPDVVARVAGDCMTVSSYEEAKKK
tara:strand:+ start:64 stop:390 length:327 start_codon:yes stop_codon:yes gene_type:complete